MSLPTVFRHPEREAPRFRPFKALSHFRKLIRNKEDTEQVFRIFEALPRKGVFADAQKFCESETGRRLMRAEAWLPSILDDHDTLKKLPVGSVGRAYVDFMESEGLTAAGLVEESEKMTRGRRQFDDQLQWYFNRQRDTHDMLHVLTGYGRDALGEQCVLAFTYGQNKSFGNIFIAYAGGFEVKRSAKSDAPVFGAIREGQRNGTAAANLVEEDITRLLAEPIADVRKRLNIGEPTKYRQAHAQFRHRGVDPYNLLAAA